MVRVTLSCYKIQKLIVIRHLVAQTLPYWRLPSCTVKNHLGLSKGDLNGGVPVNQGTTVLLSARNFACYVFVDRARLLSGRMPDSQSSEPGFESSLCYHFEVWAFWFSPRCLSPLSCINEYLAIDSGGNVIEYSSRVIAAWLECFQEKSSWCRNEQFCQG